MELRWKACSYPLAIILLVFRHLDQALASSGDRDRVYKDLLRSCLNHNCSTLQQVDHFYHHQPWDLQLLGWDCTHECRYQCMWKTVEHIVKEGHSKIPQFYGKWPFIRIFGIQEPASVIFSIGNGLAQISFIHAMINKVPSTAPMYYVGLAQSGVAVNAWIWSTVFHARDLPWTEKLDYFCAYSIVMCTLMTSLLRVFALKENRMDMKIALGITVTCVLFYLKHISYLTYVHFDYGYNMKVNIATAILNFIMMVSWTVWRIRLQPYLWKLLAFIILCNLCILLEVLDFPPVWWTFDAHSLWHASTVPLTFLYRSYYVDDCLYLHNHRVKLKKGV